MAVEARKAKGFHHRRRWSRCAWVESLSHLGSDKQWVISSMFTLLHLVDRLSKKSCPRRTGSAQKQRHKASVHLGPQVSAARTPRTSVRHSAPCLHGDPRDPIRVQRDVTGARSGVEPGLQRFPAGDSPRTDSAPVPPDPPAAGLAAACVTSGHPVWERHGRGGLSQCGYDTRAQEPRDVQRFLRHTAHQILLSCLRRTQHNYFFKALHPREQEAQLESHWSEVFLLAASYWPVDISCIISKLLRVSGSVHDADEDHVLCGVQKVISTCQALNADVTELPFLETLILLRQGQREAEVESGRLDALQEQVQLALAHYTQHAFVHAHVNTQPSSPSSLTLPSSSSSSSSSSTTVIVPSPPPGAVASVVATTARFGRLLLVLPALSTVSGEMLEKLLFPDVCVSHLIRAFFS
ncbi:hypothetical protein C0Q70_21581 [Pomacea canaliculata]|uniref:NR LBD domain-containing protein n=1 Tax=Pomacea canaliculata TaxID=400727 RepID=A0A2T7ND10_POMCA|nr:hypothetical protein C0Q70_21581 [Pomacea canaliculata]